MMDLWMDIIQTPKSKIELKLACAWRAVPFGRDYAVVDSYLHS